MATDTLLRSRLCSYPGTPSTDLWNAQETNGWTQPNDRLACANRMYGAMDS
jgi:hypothetical protein